MEHRLSAIAHPLFLTLFLCFSTATAGADLFSTATAGADLASGTDETGLGGSSDKGSASSPGQQEYDLHYIGLFEAGGAPAQAAKPVTRWTLAYEGNDGKPLDGSLSTTRSVAMT